MTTIDLHHWELADQLVAAVADDAEQTYLDTLAEVAAGGMRTALGVIAALVSTSDPEAPTIRPGET